MPGVLDSYKEEAAKVSYFVYCHQKISQKSKYPMIQSKSSVESWLVMMLMAFFEGARATRC